MSPVILVIALATLLCAVFPISPGLALVLGFFVALIPGQTDGISKRLHRISKLCIAWAILGLGATVKIQTIGALTAEYFFATLSGIALTLALAWWLGKRLGLDPVVAALVGSGTAICGASAIASVGAAVKARSDQVSMALAVVLILNAVALFVFPPIGLWLGLNGQLFAVWSGLAIHDTSSVVGAALAFDPQTVDTATTVKLARALWIAPVTVLFARLLNDKSDSVKFKLPWFIWGYVIAALIATYLALDPVVVAGLSDAARRAFRAGLFLVGATTNLASLRLMGRKPFVLGVVLWAASAGWALFII